MEIYFHRHFKKQFQKLPKHMQRAFFARLEIFMNDPNNQMLNVHRLSGQKYPLESINVNADYRALFIRDAHSVTFYEIGTHSSLYG